MAKLKLKNWAPAIITLSLILAVVLLQTLTGRTITPETTKAWIAGFGAIAPFIFVIIYAVAPLLFFPAWILTAAAGLIWGWKLAFLYSIIGANLCANIAFWIGRRLGRDRVQKLTIGKFEKFKTELADAGFEAVLFLRIVPLVPFNVLNYGAGVTNVRWRDYALASLIGMIPGAFAYVYLGANLNWRQPQLWFALAALLLLGSTSTLWKWWKSKTDDARNLAWWSWIPQGASIATAIIGAIIYLKS